MSVLRLSLWLLGPLWYAYDADAESLRAHPTQQLPIAAQIARSIRANGNDGRALPILTQAQRKESRALMDEIADTLAAIAIDPSPNDLASSRARAAALSFLFLAGDGHSGLPGEVPGIPYSGALQRLRRITDSSAYLEIRQAALMRLSSLDKSPAMIGHLRQYALANSNIAGTAVALLTDEKGAGGLAIARELFKSGAVTNSYAKRVLSARATKYGW